MGNNIDIYNPNSFTENNSNASMLLDLYSMVRMNDGLYEPPLNGGDIFETVSIPREYSLLFDGKNISFIENGKIEKQWAAYSGLDKLVPDGVDGEKYINNPKYQNVKDAGPAPAGKYLLGVLQENLQGADDGGIKKRIGQKVDNILPIFTPKMRYISHKGWGDYRMALRPQKGTDTFGRDSMYLHGGKDPGSAGCIDLTDNISNLVDFLKSKNIDFSTLPLEVKYE